MTTDPIELAAAEYTGPNRPSLLSLAEKYDIPETTLRRNFRTRGIIRGTAVQRKRQLIEDHFSGETASDPASPEVLQASIEIEAARDIEDMDDALAVARGGLKRLKSLMDALADPREIKAAIEATARAVEVIRKIRGLDAPVDFSDWSDDELEQFARTGRMPAGRR